MNLFEEEHIMVTHKKLTEILTGWGLENENISDIIYEETGNRSESASYVGEDYVIKYSSNLGKLKNSLAISTALEKAGLCVASFVKTLDEKDYVQDGELFFCVTKRLKGKQLKTGSMYTDDYVTKARYVGEVIAEALSMAESNACMRRIVAAPTAGACGVLPAVLLPLCKYEELTQHQILEAVE